MLRLAVLVSGGGTNLQAILDAIDEGTITNAEVSVVISNNAGDSVPEARCWKLCFAKSFTGQQSNRYAENDFSSSSVRHHTGKYFGGNRKLKRCAG